MAIVMINDAPEGVTLELYDAVNAHMGGVDEHPPDGMIFHSAGMVGGRVRIVDVWESREAFDRFNDERLMPAIEAVAREAGGPAPEPPQQTFYEAHHVVTRAGAGAGAGG